MKIKSMLKAITSVDFIAMINTKIVLATDCCAFIEAN